MICAFVNTESMELRASFILHFLIHLTVSNKTMTDMLHFHMASAKTDWCKLTDCSGDIRELRLNAVCSLYTCSDGDMHLGHLRPRWALIYPACGSELGGDHPHG